MLFYNGEQDGLFPVASVKEAYVTMHRVWSSQNADQDLVTKLWNAPRTFSQQMQGEAVDWLDKQLKVNSAS
jgi:hypothetical protein